MSKTWTDACPSFSVILHTDRIGFSLIIQEETEASVSYGAQRLPFGKEPELDCAFVATGTEPKRPFWLTLYVYLYVPFS